MSRNGLRPRPDVLDIPWARYGQDNKMIETKRKMKMKMKIYRVKFKDSEKVFGVYASKEEASDKVMEYIHDHYISPFDFVLEEVEIPAVDLISNFEDACQYLGLPANIAKIDSCNPANGPIIERLQKFIEEINPRHIEALMALNKLFTIAEAWNKEDGFVPDFSDWCQDKWFPWFKYDKDAEEFVFAHTDITRSYGTATIGSRLCFKTEERAAQFGKQFIELYNKVFL